MDDEMTDAEPAERHAQKVAAKHAAELSRLKSEVAEILMKIDRAWGLSIVIPERTE